MQDELSFRILTKYPRNRRYLITKPMEKGLMHSLKQLLSGGS